MTTSASSPEGLHGHGPRRRRSIIAGVILSLAMVAVALGVAWKLAPVPVQSAPPWGALDGVSVSGRVGATPAVTIRGHIGVAGVKAREVETGRGREITEDAPVLLSVTSFDGRTGENISPEGRPELVSGPASVDVLGTEIASVVIGRTEGTRLLVLHPVPAQSGATSVEISVIDILPTVAAGQEVGEGGPLQVELTTEGPVVSHTGEPPSGLATQMLIKGEGAQVFESDRIVAQFTVVGWNDGQMRASTWLKGSPELVNLSRAMKGLSQALVDQRVGSRLAVTIPPDLAAGDDTLCVVIDILGTEAAPSEAQSGVGPQSGAL